MYPWDVKHIHQEALEASKAIKGDYSTYHWLQSITIQLQHWCQHLWKEFTVPNADCQEQEYVAKSSAFQLNPQFFYKITSTTWNYESHYATLTFQRHTITHILENDISLYSVIWYPVSLAVSHRETWSTIPRSEPQNWFILLCLVPSPYSIQEQGSVKYQQTSKPNSNTQKPLWFYTNLLLIVFSFYAFSYGYLCREPD